MRSPCATFCSPPPCAAAPAGWARSRGCTGRPRRSPSRWQRRPTASRTTSPRPPPLPTALRTHQHQRHHMQSLNRGRRHPRKPAVQQEKGGECIAATIEVLRGNEDPPWLSEVKSRRNCSGTVPLGLQALAWAHSKGVYRRRHPESSAVLG